MNCQKCGRTLSFGEVCQCEHLDIFKRQVELEQEKELNEENAILEHDKNIKEKNKKIKKRNENAEKITNNISEFFKDMFFNFKNMDEIDTFILQENNSYTVALYAINFVLSIILYYMLLSKSLVSTIFTYYSAFSVKTPYVIFIASIFLSLLTILITNLCISFIINKKAVYEISAGYIYEIPLVFIIILFTCISSFIGVVLIPVLFALKIKFIYDTFNKYKISKTKSTIIISIICLISSILFFIITKLIS